MDGVEEKFRKKLAWWKSHYISKGGRLTLIRSTLSNIPTHLTSLFRLPRSIKFRLEKIQEGFPLGRRKFVKETASDQLEYRLWEQREWRVGD